MYHVYKTISTSFSYIAHIYSLNLICVGVTWHCHVISCSHSLVTKRAYLRIFFFFFYFSVLSVFPIRNIECCSWKDSPNIHYGTTTPGYYSVVQLQDSSWRAATSRAQSSMISLCVMKHLLSPISFVQLILRLIP